MYDHDYTSIDKSDKSPLDHLVCRGSVSIEFPDYIEMVIVVGCWLFLRDSWVGGQGFHRVAIGWNKTPNDDTNEKECGTSSLRTPFLKTEWGSDTLKEQYDVNITHPLIVFCKPECSSRITAKHFKGSRIFAILVLCINYSHCPIIVFRTKLTGIRIDKDTSTNNRTANVRKRFFLSVNSVVYQGTISILKDI